MKELNPRQAEGYRHDGFLFPLEGPSKEKAATCFSTLADIEAHIGASLSVR